MTVPNTPDAAPTPPAPLAHAGPATQRPRRSVTIDWAHSRDVVLTLIGSGVLLYMLVLVFQQVTKILLLFVLAALVALVLDPLVRRIEARGVPRGAATAIAYAALLLVLTGALLWAGGSLVSQLTQLNEQLPLYAQELQSQMPFVQDSLNRLGIDVNLDRLQRDAAAALQATGGELLGRGLGIATGVTDVLVGIFLVLVISLYLVVDGRRIRNNLASIIPPSRQGLFVFLEASVLHILGGYIRGQLTIAAIVGTGVGVGCWLLGVQFPLVLGALAFCFELIPMVGPLLSSIPALVVSLFQPFPLVLFVLAFFLVVMLVEGQVLSPRITGHAVGLHPIATILALIGGAEVAGMWGALFAVPLVGLGAVLGRAALNELNGHTANRERPEAPVS